MGESSISKKVLFIGAWRTQNVTDQLLRQISSSLTSKKGYGASLKLASDGLELIIFDKAGTISRRDQIPLENIVDFIDNRYSTTCTLAIVRDKQQQMYTVFVFLCKSDQDAAEMIHAFKTSKRQLSGEGYNLDVTSKGQNWTLVTKEDELVNNTAVVAPVQQNGNVRVISMDHDVDNTVYVTNGERKEHTVYVTNGEHRDNSHTVYVTNGERKDSTNDSVNSKSEMQDELYHLADEIRDIKRMLHQSKGRQQFEKHYQFLVPNATQSQPLHVQTVGNAEPDYTVRRTIHETRDTRVPQDPAKQFGFKVVQSPTTATRTVVHSPGYQEVATENVVIAQPMATQRQTIYRKTTKSTKGSKSKKHNGHFVTVTPQKVPVMVRQDTRGMRTHQYLSSQSSQPSSVLSGATYSKRVYDSANPMAEAQLNAQQRSRTWVAANRNQRYRIMSPTRRSAYGSDVLRRNIEDVYRNRTMKRVIVPQHQHVVGTNSVEYINVAEHEKPPVPTRETLQQMERVQLVEQVDDVDDEPVHVTYDGAVRGVYENRDAVVDAGVSHHTTTVRNINTINTTTVNTVPDDGLDDNVLYRGYENEYKDVTSDVERMGNVVIIRAGAEVVDGNASKVESNIIRVESNSVENHEFAAPRVVEGGVFHVKAETLQDYESHSHLGNDNVTVISTEEHNTLRQSMDDDRNGNVHTVRETQVTTTTTGPRMIVMSAGSETREANAEEIEGMEGMFGEYTRKPDETYDEATRIVETEAFRYHHDEDDHIDALHTSAFERVVTTENADSNQSEASSSIADSNRESPVNFEPEATIRRVHYSEDEDSIIGAESEHSDHRDVVIENRTSVFETGMASLSIVQTGEQDIDHEAELNNNTNDGNDEEHAEDYSMDMDALRKSMEAPDLVIIDSGANTKSMSTEYSYQADNHMISNGGTVTTTEFTSSTTSLGDKAVPLAQRYLDEDAIRQITNRTENSVLF